MGANPFTKTSIPKCLHDGITNLGFVGLKIFIVLGIGMASVAHDHESNFLIFVDPTAVTSRTIMPEAGGHLVAGAVGVKSKASGVGILQPLYSLGKVLNYVSREDANLIRVLPIVHKSPHVP